MGMRREVDRTGAIVVINGVDGPASPGPIRNCIDESAGFVSAQKRIMHAFILEAMGSLNPHFWAIPNTLLPWSWCAEARD
jgi:hypothetical protein